MKVYQVSVNKHPLLEKLWDIVAWTPRPEVNLPPDRYLELAANLANRPNGSSRPSAASSAFISMNRNQIKGLVKNVKGIHYYPPGGGMGWHTNSNNQGWRVYVIRAPGESYFGTLNEEIRDFNGYANIFKVSEDSWHYVRAVDERWSLGVQVPDDLAEQLIK